MSPSREYLDYLGDIRDAAAKVGSAGNLPAPSGNLPDGTAERVLTERPSSLVRSVPSIPSGW
jgi:hypothetical protein